MGALPNATYLSCPICYGSRVAFESECRSCADPDFRVARFVLERLRPEQIALLRAYGHTLAQQPVDDYPKSVEFFVEADDGEWDEDLEGWLVPPTRHWFASGRMRFGPCGAASFVSYNPLGLLLRECLMAGADAAVPSYSPEDTQPSPAAADTSPIVSCTSDQAFAAGPSLGDMS